MARPHSLPLIDPDAATNVHPLEVIIQYLFTIYHRILHPHTMAGALSQAELQSILGFTVALARKAGELILEGSEAIRASGAMDEKKNSVDLVTEYDVRVEELVKREISAAYPTFKL